MKKIILISGKAQSSKDTSASFMKSYLESKGERVLITHYADLLKYICKTFFNWDGNKDEIGRSILQHVGTDVVREQNPDYWVHFTIGIIDLFKDEWDYILIPDVRFPNEVEEMVDSFGRDYEMDNYGRICSEKNNIVKSVRITRQGYDNGMTWEQLNHPSECALDDYEFDYYIDNNGTIEELEIKMKDLVDKLMNK